MYDMTPFLFFLLVGVAFIVTELLIFNLSIFWSLFVGLGAIVTAFIALFVPDIAWLHAWLIFVVASAGISFALYKPLKRWQNKPGVMPGNDVVGQSVEALEDIAPNGKGKVNWSGTAWEAQLIDSSEAVQKGQSATITKAEGIVLYITRS